MRYAILGMFGTLLITLCILAALVFYPFSPFNIANVATIPDAVCPRADVEVDSDFSIEDGWTLKTLTVESTWQPIGNDNLPVTGGTATIPNPSPELANRVRSPVLRVAPEAPGEYRLRSEAEMIGTFSKDNIFSGWPKVQVIEYRAVNTLTVREASDPKCKGAE